MRRKAWFRYGIGRTVSVLTVAMLTAVNVVTLPGGIGTQNLVLYANADQDDQPEQATTEESVGAYEDLSEETERSETIVEGEEESTGDETSTQETLPSEEKSTLEGQTEGESENESGEVTSDSESSTDEGTSVEETSEEEAGLTKQDLEALVEAALELNQEQYEDESYQEFLKQVQAAQKVLDEENEAAKWQVASNALLDAWTQLVLADRSETADIDYSSASYMRDLNAQTLVYEMGTGYGYDKPFDGITAEQGLLDVNELLTQMQQLHDMGYNTIRICVNPMEVFGDDDTYKSAWISRLVQLIDCATFYDMYVVVAVTDEQALINETKPVKGEEETTLEEQTSKEEESALEEPTAKEEESALEEPTAKEEESTLEEQTSNGEEGTLEEQTSNGEENTSEEEATPSQEDSTEANPVGDDSAREEVSNIGWLELGSEANRLNTFIMCWHELAKVLTSYDEHLIFESFDAAHVSDQLDTDMVMRYNQAFVHTVRAFNGNHANRYLVLACPRADINGAVNDADTGLDDEAKDRDDVTAQADDGNTFSLTEDASGKLMLSVQYYDEHFSSKNDPNVTSFDLAEKNALEQIFSSLKKDYLAKGIPVLLSSYGCADKDNLSDRVYYCRCINMIAAKLGIVPVYQGDAYETDITQGIMEGINLPEDLLEELGKPELPNRKNTGHAATEEIEETEETEDLDDVASGLQVRLKEALADNALSCNLAAKNPVVQIRLGETLLLVASMEDGEQECYTWSSANAAIATVTRGVVIPRSIGSTTITVRDFAGHEKDVTVIVFPQVYENACTAVVSSMVGNLSMTPGEVRGLNATMNPEDTDNWLTYFATNTDCAFVSRVGNVYTKKTGITYIVAAASNGITNYWRIVVGEEPKQEIYSCEHTTPATFSMVIETKTMSSVELLDEDGNPVSGKRITFISTDEAIARVSQKYNYTDEDGQITCTIYAGMAGTTTVKALDQYGEYISFTVKVTEEEQEVETGKDIEVSEVTTIESPEEESKNRFEIYMLAALLGMMVLIVGGGLFLLFAPKR